MPAAFATQAGDQRSLVDRPELRLFLESAWQEDQSMTCQRRRELLVLRVAEESRRVILREVCCHRHSPLDLILICRGDKSLWDHEASCLFRRGPA